MTVKTKAPPRVLVAQSGRPVASLGACTRGVRLGVATPFGFPMLHPEVQQLRHGIDPPSPLAAFFSI